MLAHTPQDHCVCQCGDLTFHFTEGRNPIVWLDLDEWALFQLFSVDPTSCKVIILRDRYTEFRSTKCFLNWWESNFPSPWQLSLGDLSCSARANESQRSERTGAVTLSLSLLLICELPLSWLPCSLVSQLKGLRWHIRAPLRLLSSSGRKALTPWGAGASTNRLACGDQGPRVQRSSTLWSVLLFKKGRNVWEPGNTAVAIFLGNYLNVKAKCDFEGWFE